MFIVKKISVVVVLLIALVSQAENSVRNDIERFYDRSGSLPCKYTVYPLENPSLKEITIGYPEELLKRSGKKYPLVIFCNGTLMPASGYRGFFLRLGSWGFIAVGSEEKYSGKGRGAIELLKFMQKLDSDKNSPFYQSIDWQNVGITGHSQGGVAAFNAATKFPESKIFKAIFTMSACRRKLAASFIIRAGYDLTKIKVPVMMTAASGRNGFDEWNRFLPGSGIAPMESLRESREILRKNVSCVVIARLSDPQRNHAHTLNDSLPYLTAWFAYHLQNNQDAGRFFTGKDPELPENPRWQDVSIDLNQQ